MLEDSLFESQCDGKTRKPFTVAIAVIAHAVTIGALVLIPLLQTQALTLPPVNLSLLAPRLKTSSDVGVFSAHPQARNRVMRKSDALTAPQSIPPHIVIADDFGSPVMVPSGGGDTGRIPPDLLIPLIDSANRRSHACAARGRSASSATSTRYQEHRPRPNWRRSPGGEPDS
jgi:hypothetical protein